MASTKTYKDPEESEISWEGPFKCLNCDCKFSDLEDLRVHDMEEHHNEDPDDLNVFEEVEFVQEKAQETYEISSESEEFESQSDVEIVEDEEIDFVVDKNYSNDNSFLDNISFGIDNFPLLKEKVTYVENTISFKKSDSFRKAKTDLEVEYAYEPKDRNIGTKPKGKLYSQDFEKNIRRPTKYVSILKNNNPEYIPPKKEIKLTPTRNSSTLNALKNNNENENSLFNVPIRILKPDGTLSQPLKCSKPIKLLENMIVKNRKTNLANSTLQVNRVEVDQNSFKKLVIPKKFANKNLSELGNTLFNRIPIPKTPLPLKYDTNKINKLGVINGNSREPIRISHDSEDEEIDVETVSDLPSIGASISFSGNPIIEGNKKWSSLELDKKAMKKKFRMVSNIKEQGRRGELRHLFIHFKNILNLPQNISRGNTIKCILLEFQKLQLEDKRLLSEIAALVMEMRSNQKKLNRLRAEIM